MARVETCAAHRNAETSRMEEYPYMSDVRYPGVDETVAERRPQDAHAK